MDEQENNIRAILNYGHSFGHVIENLCGYGEYLHGEAIAIGMKIAGEIAYEKGLWNIQELKKQINLLIKYGLPVKIPKLKKAEILRILMGDKKVKDGKMRFVLPTTIGHVAIYNDIKNTDFLKFFD